MTNQHTETSHTSPLPPPITKADRNILMRIRTSIVDIGEVPSVRRIAHQAGIVQESVRNSFERLEKAGYLERTGKGYKTLRLLDPALLEPKSISIRNPGGTRMQMKPSLTPGNACVLRFIEHWIESIGSSPSSDEIRRGLGFSSIGRVQHHVTRLIDCGYLTRSSAGRWGQLVVSKSFYEAPPMVQRAAGVTYQHDL